MLSEAAADQTGSTEDGCAMTHPSEAARDRPRLVAWPQASTEPASAPYRRSVTRYSGRFKSRGGAADAWCEPAVDAVELKLRLLLIEGDRAVSRSHGRSRFKLPKLTFESAQLVRSSNRRIATLESACDTAPIVAAFRMWPALKSGNS